MKREVQDALEMAKQELIVRLTKQEQEYTQQANKFAEREDFKVALRYAMDAKKVQKRRNEIESADALKVVVGDDDAMEFFLDRVKDYIATRVKEVHRQLFLAALRPRELDKKVLSSALHDVELVATDLEQIADRYPALLQKYLDHLRAIPNDVENVLKEIE